MEYIKSKLTKFVNLTYIKKEIRQNKKIISTCIYIPSDLDYNERSIYYFQGLVKSVETFQEVMNNNRLDRDTWIYRIYYDKMFDSGINFSYKKKSTKKMTKKQKKLEMKKRKLRSKKKKQNVKKLGSFGNEYNYVFDSSVYNMSTTVMDKVYLYEDFNTKTPLNRKLKSENKIKQKLLGNEDNFKKLLKLYHLFIKTIKQNKRNTYSNIELVSYDCPIIKTYPHFIGHSSSFGMFLRFCPLLDKDVSLFYSVNSTHPITPQLAYIIKKWEQDEQSKALAIYYTTPNVVNSANNYIIQNVETIKDKIKNKDPLNNFDTGFIEIINKIINLNTLTTFHKNLFNSKGDNIRTTVSKLKTKMSQSRKLNFSKLKKIKKIELDKLNRSKTIKKDKQQINYSYNNLLYNYSSIESRYSPINGFDEAIGGGAFGLKNTFPLLVERYSVFIDFILLLLKNKIQLKYGLDELLLKIIILPDIHIYKNKIDIITIIKLHTYRDDCNNDILKLISPDTSYLTDSINNKIILRSDFYNYIITYYPEFFNTSWLTQLDHYDSRRLYVKEDKKTKLDEKEEITISINLDKLCFNSLFIAYNEHKKLLLIDKKYNKILESRDLKPYFDDVFEILYIQDYNLGKIEHLLKFLINYYRLKITQPSIRIEKIPSISKSSSKSSSKSI